MAPGFFDVPKSIINNRPQRGEDGDFIYGSGHFPLLAGNIERFSLALVYGGGQGGFDTDLQDLLKHRETVQKIYNSNYRFPVAPDKPTLTAVPGDGEVTLYWDRKAERSFDPVLKEYDFEGVITSYSIHYTKLYEDLLSRPGVDERRIQQGRRLRDHENHPDAPRRQAPDRDIRGKRYPGVRSNACTEGGVITSYSIHYTKLYDGIAARPDVDLRVNDPIAGIEEHAHAA